MESIVIADEQNSGSQNGQETSNNGTEPLISVIVPFHNIGSYVKDVLDSLVNQTFKNIEIICIDDGSTDNTLVAIRDYAARDSRIRVVCQQNRGLYVTRQVGIRAAQGDYVMFVDGDDWLVSDACECIAKMAQSTGADIIQYGVEIVAADRTSDNARWFDAWFNVTTNRIDDAEEMLDSCYQKRAIPWNVATKAIRKSVARQAIAHQGEFYINQLEDFLSCFYYFFFSKTWVRLDRRLYCYRYGNGMSTRKTMTFADFEKNIHYFDAVEHIRQFVNKHELSARVRKIADDVIPQYVMFDALQTVLCRLDCVEDSQKWSKVLLDAAGARTTVSSLARRLVDDQRNSRTEKNRWKRKYKKYRQLFFAVAFLALAEALLIVFLL